MRSNSADPGPVSIVLFLTVLMCAIILGFYVSNTFNDGGKGWIVGICVFAAGAVLIELVSSFLTFELTKSKVMTSIVILLLSMLGLTFFLVLPYRALNPFKSHISEYVTFSQLKASPTKYIRGKVITIDKKLNSINGLYLQLSEALRPDGPNEVGTVVWLDCSEVKVGYYGSNSGAPLSSGGPGAFQWQCYVTVIDKSEAAVVEDKKLFYGSSPPSQSTGSTSGTYPTEEILAFLEALPRK